MIKTVEDIAKIAVPLIFLRFRSFLPPPSAASSVSQGHRFRPVSFAVSDRQPSFQHAF